MLYAHRKILLLVLMAMQWGCSADDLRRASYNALLDRQCMVESGQPNCDPERMSYEAYREQREKVLGPGTTQ